MKIRDALVLALLLPAAAWAQSSGFSGTWRLVQDESHTRRDVTLAGLIGVGAPPSLHITAPSNGTLLVESPINESHSRFYVPGGRTTTPIFLGTAGRIEMTSRWEGETLVAEGTRTPSSDTGETAKKVREIFRVGEEGRRLEIEVSVSDPEGQSSATFVYRRIRDIGACESWPTPCKEFQPRRR